MNSEMRAGEEICSFASSKRDSENESGNESESGRVPMQVRDLSSSSV